MAPSELDLVLKAAGEFVRQDRLHDAAEALRSLDQLYPDNMEVCALSGLVMFRLGRYAEALPYYERLVRASLTDGISRLNLGIVLLKLDRAEDAIAHLEAARTLDPGQPKTVSYLGLAYASAGLLAEAYRAFCHAGQADLAREVAQGMEQDQVAAIDRELSSPRHASRPISHPPPLPPLPPPPLPGSQDLGPPVPRARRESHVERMVREIAPAKVAAGNGAVGSDMTLLSRFATSRLDAAPSKGFSATPHGAIVAAVTGALCARLKDVVAYSGELASGVLSRRSRGHQLDEPFGLGDNPVYRVTGTGSLTWQRPDAKLLELDDDILYLPEEFVLAFSDELRWENGYVPGTNRARSFVQFRGTGTVAVAWPMLPRGLKVGQRQPQYVAGTTLLGWVGRIVPRATPAPGFLADTGPFSWLECSGEGVVFVEQPAA